ncbi:beta-microseminoprotein A1-like [Pelodytes ibericus]
MSLSNSNNFPKTFLPVAVLALGSLVILCEAACIDRSMRLELTQPKPDVCIDGNEERTINSTWMAERCMKCMCTSSGISCCSLNLKPTVTDDSCEVVFHETSCTYEIRRKDNGARDCGPVYYM